MTKGSLTTYLELLNPEQERIHELKAPEIPIEIHVYSIIVGMAIINALYLEKIILKLFHSYILNDSSHHGAWQWFRYYSQVFPYREQKYIVQNHICMDYTKSKYKYFYYHINIRTELTNVQILLYTHGGGTLLNVNYSLEDLPLPNKQKHSAH